jgi:hypothetical protein
LSTHRHTFQRLAWTTATAAVLVGVAGCSSADSVSQDASAPGTTIAYPSAIADPRRWCDDTAWVAAATTVYYRAYGSQQVTPDQVSRDWDDLGSKLQTTYQQSVSENLIPPALDGSEVAEYMMNLSLQVASGRSLYGYESYIVPSCKVYH